MWLLVQRYCYRIWPIPPIFEQGETLMVFTVVILTLGLTMPAAAYTDPGTGIMMWQLLTAALAAVMFKLRAIVTWVQKRRSK